MYYNGISVEETAFASSEQYHQWLEAYPEYEVLETMEEELC
jgi:hypothetical protein